MAKTTKETELKLEKLEGLVAALSAKLDGQKAALERNIEAVEKLTRLLQKIEQAVQKSAAAKSISPELDELVKLFVNYEINPQYYEEHYYKMLSEARPAGNTALTIHPKNRRRTR